MGPGPTGRESGEAPRYFTRRRIIRAGVSDTWLVGPGKRWRSNGRGGKGKLRCGPGADSAAGKKN